MPETYETIHEVACEQDVNERIAELEQRIEELESRLPEKEDSD